MQFPVLSLAPVPLARCQIRLVSVGATNDGGYASAITVAGAAVASKNGQPLDGRPLRMAGRANASLTWRGTNHLVCPQT